MTEEKNVTADAATIGEGPRPSNASTIVKTVKIVGGLVLVSTLIFFGRQASGYLLEFAEWVEAQGALGPVVFIAAYAVGTVAAVPGAVLTMVGGAIFGLAWGTLWVFCAATLGSASAFLIARYVARDAIEKKIQGNEKFAAIDRAVGQQGRKIVFLLRLTPVFPFSLGNYALGLTRVRFIDYLLGGFGMLPGSFLFVYYGKTVGDLAAIAAGTEVDGGSGQQALTVVGLVATVIVTVLITRVARKALREATAAASATEKAEGQADV